MESAFNSWEIKFGNDDETPLNPAIQKGTLEKLLSRVERDFDTDGVRRSVNMSKEVYICKRKKYEAFLELAEQFCRHAKTYLNHSHASHAMHDTQNFAMILLENVSLPAATFNIIVSLLVESAKEGANTATKNYNIH